LIQENSRAEKTERAEKIKENGIEKKRDWELVVEGLSSVV
jgi:hypothetical protein